MLIEVSANCKCTAKNTTYKGYIDVYKGSKGMLPHLFVRSMEYVEEYAGSTGIWV